MNERLVGRMLAPVWRRLSMMIARGTVALSDAGRKMQALQVRLLADEVKDNVEHMEPYGYTSRPLAGAEVVTLFLDGDRSHGIVIVAADRRYRLQGLEGGEVALYNADDAEPEGCRIVLKRDGLIEVRAKNIDFKAAENLRLEGDTVKVHAATRYAFDCNGQGQAWDGSKVDRWQLDDTAGVNVNHAPPEIP